MHIERLTHAIERAEMRSSSNVALSIEEARAIESGALELLAALRLIEQRDSNGEQCWARMYGEYGAIAAAAIAKATGAA